MEKVIHEIDAKKVTDYDKEKASEAILGKEVTADDIVKLYTDKDNPLVGHRKYDDEILPSDEPSNTWIHKNKGLIINMTGKPPEDKDYKKQMSYSYVYKNLTKFRVVKWVAKYKEQIAIGIIGWELQDKISDMLNEKMENDIPNPGGLISIKELSLKWNIPKRTIVLYLKNGCFPYTWYSKFTDLNRMSKTVMTSGTSLNWFLDDKKQTTVNWSKPSKKQNNDKLYDEKFIPLSEVKSFEMRAETIRTLTPNPNSISIANTDNTHVYRMLQLLMDKVEDIERRVVYKF